MSDDLIRRSDAIAEIRKARTPDVASYQYAQQFINAVCRAPSADRPQLDKDIVEPIGNGNVIMSEDTYEDLLDRPQGEWIEDYNNTYGRCRMKCSVCGKFSGIGGIKSNQRKPFCPNCGADMRGGHNE